MAVPRQQMLVIADLRGGQNSADPPHSIPETQCVAAVNVDWWGATLAHKRAGTSTVVPTWQGLAPPSFTDVLDFLHTQRAWRSTGAGGDSILIPSMVAIDDDGVMGVVCSGSARKTYVVTNSTLITGYYALCQAVELNGACYMTGVTAKNRTLVLEQTGGGTTAPEYTLRYTGISTSAAATVADTGAGTYPSVLRYYKIAFTAQNLAGTTVRRSELSASISFTPSGGGTAARVTQPTPPGEGETHWELYGSADNVVYKLLATVAVATTTYDDGYYPPTYAGNAPPTVGSNTVPVAWKYIAVHGNRLLGIGSLNSSTYQQSRVWFTPVLGASDVGDLERVPAANYIDLDENDGDYGTALIGNFLGAVYAFKYRQIWKLVPTGDADAPFSKVCLTKEVGCISQKSCVVGEDENGNPALYFLSHRGPMRLSAAGLEYIGHDIEDIWATVNLNWTYAPHGIYHNERHQVWFWLPISSGTEPSIKMMFDVSLGRRGTGGVRGGWAKHTGISCAARCSCMNNDAALSISLQSRRPYVGANASVGLLLACDTGTQDGGSNYQAYVTTKPINPGGLGTNCNVGQSTLLAAAGNAVTITQTLNRDYGLESRTSTCLLTASASETRVMRQFEGSDTNGAGVVQITVGDGSAANVTWTLDALVVPFTVQEQR